MELNKFISESLKSIISGINDAQDFAKDNGAIINPDLRKWDYDKMFSIERHREDGFVAVYKVDFDIAVSATDEKSSGGKAGLNVYSLSLGGNKSKTEQNETISRIKFSVNTALPSVKAIPRYSKKE